jgi:hypothetical protein
LIDQLQSFIPIIDPSMSRINWSTMKSHKKLRLELSLCLWNLVSFGFINNILFYFVISYICLSVSGLLVFVVSGDVFYTLSFYLRTLRVVVDIKKKTNLLLLLKPFDKIVIVKMVE